MIKLHNSFTIKTHCGEQSALNQVLIPVPRALLSGGAYAKYIRLYTLTGVESFLTETVSVNSNAGRGALSASFAVTLEKSALAGESIVAFALSADGVTDVNYAALAEPFLKSNAEVEIVAAVYLELTVVNCSIVHVDRNRLICALLGAEPFQNGDVYAQWGTCTVSERYSITDTVAKTENRIQAISGYIGDTLRLLSTLPASARDVVFFVGGTPAVRVAVDVMLQTTWVLQKNVTAERTMSADTARLFWAGNATQGSSAYTGVQILNVPNRFVKSADRVVMSFDRNLRLISDPSHRSAAFYGDKELFLIGAKNGRLDVLARLDVTGASVFMPEYNEIVLIEPSRARAYRYTDAGGFAQITSVALAQPGTGKCAVAKRGTSYVITRELTTGRVERGYFSLTYTAQQSVTALGTESYFRNRYMAAAVAPSNVCIWDNLSVDTASQNNITSFYQNQGAASIADAGDGLIHFYKPENPAFNCVYAIAANSTFLMPEAAQIKLCGDYIVTKLADGTRQLYYYYRDAMQLVPLSIEHINTVAEVAEIDGLLLVRRDDGTLEEWGIVPERSYLYHPLFAAAASASVSVTGLSAFTPAARTAVITVS